MSFFSSIISGRLLKDAKTQWFLVAALGLFALLRIPSLVEPNWYGDEGIYQVVGKAIYQGEILYKEIWDNKPPLLYYIYALFNGNLFYVKISSLVTGLFSVLSFFLLTTELFKKDISRFVATGTYAILFATPLIEGNIANAENFMLLPVTISAFLVLRFIKIENIKYLILAGLLLSIALITKIVAVFDFLTFISFLIILNFERIYPFKSKFNYPNYKNYLTFSLSFLSLLVISMFYFFANNALPDFFSGVFSENVNYVNVSNDFIFPMGVLILKTIILIIALYVVFHYRKNLSVLEIFIYLWLAFSIYNALFSQRAYIHYSLVMLPPFSLILGRFFENRKRFYINIVLVITVILLVLNHFTIFKKTFSYYLNYYQFITGSINFNQYSSFFDSQTPRDYEIANYLVDNTLEKEKIFLWSNNAQIYALSDKLPIGKYVVAYHITFYENAVDETINLINENKPKFIIQNAPEKIPTGILDYYKLRYELDGAKIYEREI